MKKFPLFAVLLCPFTLAGLAAKTPDDAPAPAPKAPIDFKSLDADADGRLTLAEFVEPAEKYREAERKKAKARPKESAGAPGDDGIVSPTDSVEGRYTPEVFRLLDVNHDQAVTPKEWEALATSAHNISQP